MSPKECGRRLRRIAEEIENSTNALSPGFAVTMHNDDGSKIQILITESEKTK